MKSKLPHYILVLLIFACLWVESLCASQLISIKSQIWWARLLYPVMGLMLAGLAFLKPKPQADWPLPQWISASLPWLLRVCVATVLFVFTWYAIDVVKAWSLEEHINYGLENLQTHAIRFLKGLDPYFLIDKIWTGNSTIYQAGMWIPLLPAAMMGWDIRWISLGFLVGGLALVYGFYSRKNSQQNVFVLLSLLPLGYLFVYFITHTSWPLQVSVEGIVVFWYLLLGLAIIKKNPYLQGFALVMCLLSRPAIAFWIPVWWLFLYLERSRKEALTVLWVSLLCLTAFLILPFKWAELDYFFQLPQTFTEHAKDHWLNHSDSYLPYLGLAKFFAPNQLDLLLKLQLLYMLVVPAALLGMRYVLLRMGHRFPASLWGLVGIKLSLLVYTQLHPLPSNYLSLSNTFFSFLLFFHVLELRLLTKPEKAKETRDLRTFSFSKLSPETRTGLLLVAGLTLFTLLEVLANTRFVRIPFTANFSWSSVVYLISGLGIAIIPLFRIKAKTIPNLLPDANSRSIAIVKWLCVALIAFTFIQKGSYILRHHDLDYHQADMLPIMKIQAERFLDGEEIYTKLKDIWRGTFRPIYMTGFWSPFVPFVKAGVDLRWASITAFMLSLGLIVSLVPTFKRNQNLFFLIGLLPLLFLYESVWGEQEPILRHTAEGLVMFYYVLLGYGIWKKNPYLIGIAIGFCLLSRFSLLPWVPFYALYAFFFERRRDVYIAAAIATGIVLFLFLIPYGFENWDFFFNHPHRYQDYAERSWERNTKFFANTLGVAKFFTQETVRYQHKLQLVLVFLAPATMFGIWFWLKRKGSQLLSDQFLGLCTLKISLVCFYNFIVMPVFYLFFVNTILSLVILYAYLGEMSKRMRIG